MGDQHIQKKDITIIAIMILGAFVAVLNETLLNVAIPKIMEDLGIQPNTAQWLTTGYLLVIGILIPTTAYLMQRFSTRGLFLSAMCLFTIGTLVAAVSPNFGVLLIGRLIQASGTALIFPLLTNVVLAVIPVHKRGSAMGTIGIVITFAPAIGPTLSGLIVEHFSWRVLFYSVLPISLIVILFAVVLLKNVTDTNDSKIDPLSVLLSTLGFGGIVFGFSSAGEGHGGWSDPEVLAACAIGFGSLALFTWRQLAMGHPMLDLRTFRYGMFRLSVIIMMIVMMVMFSSMMLLPIFLQNAMGYTPLDAGFIMLPGGILMGMMSPITGRLFDKFGAKWLALTGLGLMLVTLTGFTLMTMSTPYLTIMFLNTIFMLGISMLMMPVMTNGVNQLPRSLYPHGTAIISTLQQVGGAIGTALLITVMTTSTDRFLAGRPDAATNKAVQLEGLTAGMSSAFLFALGLAVVAIILSLFLKRTSPPAGDGEARPSTAQ